MTKNEFEDWVFLNNPYSKQTEAYQLWEKGTTTLFKLFQKKIGSLTIKVANLEIMVDELGKEMERYND